MKNTNLLNYKENHLENHLHDVKKNNAKLR